MKKNLTVILCGLFVALDVVFGRILTIDLGIVRSSMVFLPVAVGGILFGTFRNALIYAAADIVGALLFPTGPFHPGFTLSAFLSGAACGFFLGTGSMTIGVPIVRGVRGIREFRRIRLSDTLVKTCLASLTVIFIDMLLNTLWVSTLYGKAYLVLLAPRVLKSILMLPINVIMVGVCRKYFGKLLPITAIGAARNER